MLISVYTSKGGGSKSTTCFTLLSAVAQFNSVNPDKLIKVLAVDLDGDQASLTKFSLTRNSLERPDYGITFQTYNSADIDAEGLISLSEDYDLTIVDVRGVHDEGTLRKVMVSDLVITPTNLSVIEFAEANDSLNRLSVLREEANVPGYQALLLTRTPIVINMTPKFSKVLFNQMLESGHSILNAKLSTIYAYQLQMDYGAYLFEMEDDGGKGVIHALREANNLLKAVMTYSMLDTAGPGTYQQKLTALGNLD